VRLFDLFYRVYFASEKHVTRTSKTPYNWKAVNAWFLLAKIGVTRNGKFLIAGVLLNPTNFPILTVLISKIRHLICTDQTSTSGDNAGNFPIVMCQ
jgi:hypothetical protein